jgi:hypothetical protein
VAATPQHSLGSIEAAEIFGWGERPSISQISPMGGIALHWLMTTIMMIAMSGIQGDRGPIGIPGLLQTYAHMIVLCKTAILFLRGNWSLLTIRGSSVLLGVFWYRLSSREQALIPEANGTNQTGNPEANETEDQLDKYRLSCLAKKSLGWRVFIFFCIVVYSGVNIAMVVLGPMRHLLGDPRTGSLDSEGWVIAAVPCGLIIISILYHVLIFGGAEVRYYDFRKAYTGDTSAAQETRWKSGWAFPSLKPPADEFLKRYDHGLLPRDGLLRFLNIPLTLAGVNVTVRKELAYPTNPTRTEGSTPELERIAQYGQRFRVHFELPDSHKVCMAFLSTAHSISLHS